MTLAYENRGWDSSVYSSGAKWTCRKLNACDSVAGLIVTVISKSNYKVRREYTAIMTTLSDVLTDLDISTEDVDCAVADQAHLDDWELLASLHDCADVFGDETAAFKLAMKALRDRMDALKENQSQTLEGAA